MDNVEFTQKSVLVELKELDVSQDKKNERKLSFNRQELDQVLITNYSPENLVGLLKSDFGKEYESSAGVWEGYLIGEHTLMVMNQFEKYFSGSQLPGNVDKNLFRVMLSLHDLGKMEAIQMKDKNLQHKYTVQIVDDVLSQLEYSENEIKLVRSLISTDALGDYIRYGDLEKNTQRIKGLAFYTGKNPMDFLELLTIFYKVDAGSYTKDAGGKESLDYLFEFNKENHKVDFSHKIKNTVEKLQQAVAYSKP